MMGGAATRVMSGEDPEAIALASRILQDKGVVAIPTETVYGLAANALCDSAVSRIFEIKGRPQDNPLIVHICDIGMWQPLVESIPPEALTLAERFWPGPLTIILKKSRNIGTVVTAGLESVAVRMPSHPVARRIIAECGLPLAAPSANLSGHPSPTTAAHCLHDLAGKVELIVDGGECNVGIESTVISLVGQPTLLRPGAISPDELSGALGREVAVAHAVTNPLAEGEKAASPGMKYRHYAPRARMTLVEGSLKAFMDYLNQAPSDVVGLVFEGEECRTSHRCVVFGIEHDPESQARGLFAALRELDDMGAERVYARCPDHDAEALGVYNRMLRAAAFEVVKL